MIKRLFLYTPGARRKLGVAIALASLGGFILLLEASSIASITNGALLGGKSLQELLPALWWLLGWIVLRMILQKYSDHLALEAASRMKSDLRLRMTSKLVELGPQYVKGERSGELISTLCEGIEQLESYVAKYVPQKVLSVYLPFTVLLAAFVLDWISAGILIVTLPILVVFMIIVGIAAKKHADRQFRVLGQLSGHFFDVLRGLPTLIMFNRSKAQVESINKISEQFRTTTMSTLRIAFLSAMIMELFATLSTAVVAVFLGLRLISGSIEFYKAFCVLILVPEFYNPIRNLGTQYHTGMNGVTAAERVFEVLDAEVLGWPEKEAGVTLPESSNGYRIEFDQVSVQYPGCDAPVLTEVTFHIEPGEQLAIVGPSGAGKSTLLDLIFGFVRPASGRILIDGIDMSELSMKWWRNQIASTRQSVHLFHGSVLDNLKLGNETADKDEVMKATTLTNAHSFITQLPEGYDTVLSEQIQLSGGQIQRIVLARMLLKNSSIWIMDEPTAQLDLENAVLIHKVLEHCNGERSSILVTHDMDMAQAAARILVISDGRVVEMIKSDVLDEQEGLVG